MAAGVPARLTPAEGRTFGFTLAGAFAVLAGVLWWRDKATASWIMSGIAAAFALGGALVPTALGPVQRGWMAMALAISKVTTPIFLGIVYFLVLTPIGLVRRAFGAYSLRHAEREGGFWVVREGPQGSASDLSRQF